ncbi:O-methyltransferase [Microcella humidisoli]|uniref:Class I SAM-dependent methyltransferase n=1 Tax=Microcella humidisoli TaxID=2963406 RepID=A0ABY5FTV6_9MICO|nr:class I SAM-dependent methyltransferase [Microcella humidisoli]UTT61722.1 class I SAM-dependent methyltransferase [Microcella humidisoli]
MASKDLSWKYVEDQTVEPDVVRGARAQSLELGVEAVSPATGAQLAVIAAALAAESIIEIGTGIGVSGLWLLQGAPDAQLTSIDVEADHHEAARRHFTEAGHAPARVRLITGRAADVLPRMNEHDYDVVLIDADAASLLEYVEHALRLVRAGGAVLVPHALWRDTVADPAKRDGVTADLRGLIAELRESPAVHVAISPVGDGLLQLITAR